MYQSVKEAKKTFNKVKNTSPPTQSTPINLPASSTLQEPKAKVTKAPTKQSTGIPKAYSAKAATVYGLSKPQSPLLQNLLERDEKESQVNVIDASTSPSKKESNQPSLQQKSLEKDEKDEKEKQVKPTREKISLEKLMAKEERDSQINVINHDKPASSSAKESKPVQTIVKPLDAQPKSSTTTIQESLLSKQKGQLVNLKPSEVAAKKNPSSNKAEDTNENNANDNKEEEKIILPKNFNERLRALEKEGSAYKDLVYYLEDWAVRIESDKIPQDQLVEKNILPLFDEAKKIMANAKELQACFASILIMDEDPHSKENVQLISFLSDFKLDINYFSSATGRALLHEAVLHGKLVSVKTLLEKNANVRIKNKNNIIPLMLIFYEDITTIKPLEDVNEEMLNVLVKKGGNPIGITDNLGASVESLLTASYDVSKHKDKEKKYKKIKETLEKTKVSPKYEETFPNKLNKYHHTRPNPKTREQMYDDMKKIAAKYPDLMLFFDEISAKRKKLAEKKPDPLVEHLIQAKHKVRRAQRHETYIIEVLISYFEKLLDFNEGEKIRSFIRNFTTYKLNVNIVDYRRESLLHKAVFRRNAQAIGYLLDCGIDCNLQDNSGKTALHWLFFDKGAVIPLNQINEKILWGLLDKTDITIKDKNGKTIVDYFNEAVYLANKNAEMRELNNKIVEKFGVILRRANEEYEKGLERATAEQEGVLNKIKFNAIKAINDGVYAQGKKELKVNARILLDGAYKTISEKVSIEKRKDLLEKFEEFKTDLYAKIDSDYFAQYVQAINQDAEEKFKTIKQDFERYLNSLRTKDKKELTETSEMALDQASRRISPHIAQTKIAEYKLELQNIREKFLAGSDKYEEIKEARPQSPGPTALSKKLEKTGSSLSSLLRKSKEEDDTYRSRAESLKAVGKNFKKMFSGSSDKLEIVRSDDKKEITSSSTSSSLSLTSSTET